MIETQWQSAYERIVSEAPVGTERPLIGITATYEDGRAQMADVYYKSVLRAGGTPILIPPYRVSASDRCDELESLLDRLDGILFSGGADLNPLLLGEDPIPALHGVNPERDVQELLLCRLADDRQIPILGICRGIQLMMAALGGEVEQDIYTCTPAATIKHSQDAPRDCASHLVTVEPDSALHGIYGATTLAVNSFHHQAVRRVAPGFCVTARSNDGVIEAVERTDHRAQLGVQWHPEVLANTWDTEGNVFTWLVDEARTYAHAKRLHATTLTLDSHCDTPMFFHKAERDEAGNVQPTFFTRRNPEVLVDLHKMREGYLDCSIMVAYLKQLGRSPEELVAATAKADDLLTQIEQMVGRADGAGIAYTPTDIQRLKSLGRKAVMLGIENAYAVGSDLSNVERFRQRGVVYMTLCHNGDNDVCDSCRGNAEHGGVSDFGSRVIAEMNRTGMMVDLSHAAEKSFYDAIDISTQPIVCSHSSARALCNHPRNLTDDQMRALARSGGVAQVTLYPGFLREVESEATVLDAVAHLDHMVSIMGVEHVGFGSDFDGDGGVPGCASAAQFINFTRHLLRRRYSDADLRLILGGNFLRLMEQVQKG